MCVCVNRGKLEGGGQADKSEREEGGMRRRRRGRRC